MPRLRTEHASVDGEALTVASQNEPREPGQERLLPPTDHGGTRYLVIERADPGDHGGVQRAYDTRLQREVALQSVSAQVLHEETREALLRAAQALAKLSHPNVIAIYDVTTAGDDVVIALEHVPGVRLDAWLQQPGRSWRQVLAVFLAAGRGLAAAHAVGLVHRNFQPANVLVGDDGRVRVTDFGLHGSIGSTAAPNGGDPLDTQADQHAFCCALSRALEGKGHVPRRIGEAVQRGMEADPAQRWPTIDVLLQALSHDPRQRWRTWMLAGSAVMAAGASTAAWGALRLEHVQPCTGAPAQLAEVWSPQRREAIERAMLGTNAVYAADVWARVGAGLEAYTAGWIAMHTAACEATTLRGEQAPEVMDLRMKCLNAAKIELAAITDALTAADTAVVGKAHELIAHLPVLERCADVEALLAEVPPPQPAYEAAVEAIRVRLAEARVLAMAGKLPDELERVETLIEEARSIPYAPLATELSLAAGVAAMRNGLFASAETRLRETLRNALQRKQWPVAADAASTLVHLVGALQLRPAEALAHAATARGLVTYGPPTAEATLMKNVGNALQNIGRHAEAEKAYLEALRMLERELGSDHPDVAASRDALGRLMVVQGRFAEAEAYQLAALRITEAALGPQHPNVGFGRINLGIVYTRQARYKEAEAQYRAARSLLETVLGPQHPAVASVRINLAVTLKVQGRIVEAIEEYQRLLPLLEKTLGPEHPHVASTRSNLASAFVLAKRYPEAEREQRAVLALQSRLFGSNHDAALAARHNLAEVLEAQQRFAEAEVEYRSALTGRLAALGPDHPDVALSRVGLGRVLARRGHLAEGEAELRMAVALCERIYGSDHPHSTTARTALAELLLERHDAASIEEARGLLEAAWKLLEHEDDGLSKGRADIAFAYARAMWAQKTTRAVALQMAATARSLYREDGIHPGDVAKVDAWMRARRK